MNALDLLFRRDAVSSAVAMLLLLMSVGSWVVLLWKSWLLQRASKDVGRSTQAFWQAASYEDGLSVVRALSDAWGVIPTHDSKWVWSRLPLTAPPDEAPPRHRITAPGEDPRCEKG